MKTKALADKYDGKIMVGFAHYYRPAYQKMLELVKTGMFGEPVDIAFSRLSPGFGFHAKNLGASWRTDPDLACGMTVESVSHDWKLITAMAGGFDTISCNYTGTIASVPKFDNHTSISIRLRNGAIGTIAASWACDIPTCSPRVHRHEGLHLPHRRGYVRVHEPHLEDRGYALRGDAEVQRLL